ncbi:polysaccharide deacetylase family protein [uncultured Pseudokineococcus sp.]|uniref:polysaccharide deacetylase family protein n=1 Tax=uncultured Pseudokineococcus sp. TaxID=1642928 RepID=UPI0026038A6C|nr:polysaccharide deacetylase family protein [uncultured Pseudokineococcus sp.]
MPPRPPCSPSRTTARRRTAAGGLLAALVAAVALVPVSAGGAPAAAAATCPASSGEVLHGVPGSGRAVALTFDDGPSTWTPQVLDVLRSKGVRATFFVTGDHVARHPDVARRIVAEGHVIANHTQTHPQDVPGSVPRGRFDQLPASAQRDQLDRATRAVRDVTGVVPCLFRGPGGHQSSATTRALLRERRLGNVHWTVDSRDWEQPAGPSRGAVDAVVRAATTGGGSRPVVLLHDGQATARQDPEAHRGSTVAALPRIIDAYTARGHRFTTPDGRPFPSPRPAAPEVPVAADVDGDGRDDPGLFSAGRWSFLSSRTGLPVLVSHGTAGDAPLVGDWDGDGRDGIGVARRGVLHLRQTATAGPAQVVVRYGSPGDVPLAGDWDGDGRDTPGLRRGTRTFLARELRTGTSSWVQDLGGSRDQVLAGDWDGDGRDTLGVVAPDGRVVVTDSPVGSPSPATGARRATVPAGARVAAGDWHGQGRDALAVLAAGRPQVVALR